MNNNLGNLKGLLDWLRGDGFSRAASLSHLSSREKRHLQAVYSLMFSGMVVAGLGVVMSNYLIGYNNTTLSSITGIGGMIGGAHMMNSFGSVLPRTKLTGRELIGFELSALSLGILFSPMILFASYFYTHILVQALVGSFSLFAALSVSSIFASRRSYLWIYAGLMSITSYMFWMSILNLLFRNSFISHLISISGLLSSLGFILVDTQIMLENGSYGSETVIHDSFRLLSDFLKLFIHILSLLFESEHNNKERNKKKT